MASARSSACSAATSSSSASSSALIRRRSSDDDDDETAGDAEREEDDEDPDAEALPEVAPRARGSRLMRRPLSRLHEPCARCRSGNRRDHSRSKL